MPPQTNVHADAPQPKSSKGFLAFLKPEVLASRRWLGRATVRTLGDTWSSNTPRAARRPVFE
jgi:hypothetical protein